MLFVMMLISSCAPAREATQVPANTGIIPHTSSFATEPIVETETPKADPSLQQTQVATQTQSVAITPTFSTGPDETLMVNTDGPTPYLVDDQGRSLYIYMKDKQHSGVSACVDDCAVEWPPLTVSATPAAGPGVDPLLLGTISRAGGSTQATYNGWPLYYYNMDTIPGTTNGPSFDGLWFLLSPRGAPVR